MRAIQSVPQVRIQERIVEEISDVGVPQLMDETARVENLTPQGQVQRRTVEQTVATQASQVQEKLIEVTQLILQERISERIGAKLASRIQEKLFEVIQLIRQERISERIVERFIDVPVSQIQERRVEVMQGIPEERMENQTKVPAVRVARKTAEIPQSHVPDTPFAVQHQGPMVQKVWMTSGAPQSQFIDEAIYFPVAAQREIPTNVDDKERWSRAETDRTVQRQARHRDEADMLVADQHQPVVMQRQASTVQCAQGAVEVPLVRSRSDVMDVPGVKQRRVSTTMQTARKTREAVQVAKVIPQQLV